MEEIVKTVLLLFMPTVGCAVFGAMYAKEKIPAYLGICIWLGLSAIIFALKG